MARRRGPVLLCGIRLTFGCVGAGLEAGLRSLGKVWRSRRRLNVYRGGRPLNPRGLGGPCSVTSGCQSRCLIRGVAGSRAASAGPYLARSFPVRFAVPDAVSRTRWPGAWCWNTAVGRLVHCRLRTVVRHRLGSGGFVRRSPHGRVQSEFLSGSRGGVRTANASCRGLGCALGVGAAGVPGGAEALGGGRVGLKTYLYCASQ